MMISSSNVLIIVQEKLNVCASSVRIDETFIENTAGSENQSTVMLSMGQITSTPLESSGRTNR
jgi:hypothetical protein